MTAETILYPVIPQAVHSRCSFCWQPGPTDMCADPANDHLLRRLCSPCSRALAAGQGAERLADLTGEQRAEAWEWLARQHINHRAATCPLDGTGVTAEVIDEAIYLLSPLTLDTGWDAFEGLCEDLLAVQKAEDGDVDYASLEPDWQHPETYTNHLRGLVDDVVHKLIGKAS